MPPEGSTGGGTQGSANPEPGGDAPVATTSSATPAADQPPTSGDTPVSSADMPTATSSAVTPRPTTNPEPATATTAEVATATPPIVPLPEGGGMQLYIGLILGAVALIAGAYGLAQVFQQKGEKAEKEKGDPCADIKLELELKERALDALKEKAAEAVGLAEVKKLNDAVHDLANAVQTLRTQYQICILELPDIPGQKILSFLPAQVPLVTARTLTSKERIDKDDDVDEGDEVALVDLESGKRFGTATVTKVVKVGDGRSREVTFEYHSRGWYTGGV